MPRELSFIGKHILLLTISSYSLDTFLVQASLIKSCTIILLGMSVREWRKESSLRLVRIWLPLRKITKKLEWIPSKEKAKVAKSTNW